jgi:hypothetical protein
MHVYIYISYIYILYSTMDTRLFSRTKSVASPLIIPFSPPRPSAALFQKTTLSERGSSPEKLTRTRQLFGSDESSYHVYTTENSIMTMRHPWSIWITLDECGKSDNKTLAIKVNPYLAWCKMTLDSLLLGLPHCRYFHFCSLLYCQ